MNCYTTQNLFRAFSICASVFAFNLSVHTQTLLFYEDFDGSPPINQLFNVGDALLIAGPSPCGKASWGDTSDFNSALVDFDASLNPSHFMAVNPQSPCGGYYTAEVLTDTLDFSGMDSIEFSCSYLITNTLGWGPTLLQVVFDNGTNTDTISAEFSSINLWDDVVVMLDPAIISSSVIMHIQLGGGNGVGVDNILINGYTSGTGVNEQANTLPVLVYPNPVGDFLQINAGLNQITTIRIMDMQGKLIETRVGDFSKGPIGISTQTLINGMYTLGLETREGNTQFTKILVQHP